MDLNLTIGNLEGTAKTEIKMMMMDVPSGKNLSRKTTTNMEEEEENSIIVETETETWTVNCVITGSLEKVDKVLKLVMINLCRGKGPGAGKAEC